MVRAKNSSSVKLSGSTVPTTPEELSKYLNDEMPRLWAAIRLLAAGHVDVTYAEPTKPRDGDERYADGTSWNPGSGRGKYLYKINTWTFLG